MKVILAIKIILGILFIIGILRLCVWLKFRSNYNAYIDLLSKTRPPDNKEMFDGMIKRAKKDQKRK